MKSILFHFRHHIGMFYALSMGLLGFIVLPLIGIGVFELSKTQIIPFPAKELLSNVGALVAGFAFPIAILIMLIFRWKYRKLQREFAQY